MAARILGVDIAKKTIDVALESESGWLMEHFSNSPQGYQALWKWLTRHGAESVIACMEASGNYWVSLATWLTARDQVVHVANPLSVHKYIKSNLQRTKTDKEDARLIGAYAVNLRAQPGSQIRRWTPPTRLQQELRALSRRLAELGRRRTAATNRSQDPLTSESVQRSYEREVSSLDAERALLEQEMDELIAHDPELQECRALLQTGPVRRVSGWRSWAPRSSSLGRRSWWLSRVSARRSTRRGRRFTARTPRRRWVTGA